MAPKRGGGGGGGSSSSSGGGIDTSCPGAFAGSAYSGYYYTWTTVAYFALYCIFFVFFTILAISLCCVRKRHGVAKRLVGPIFIISVTFSLLYNALLIIGVMLRECKTTPYYTYYNWSLAANLFANLANYLLLIVFVWGVNILLRERLGSGRSLYKGLCLGILLVMGALTCASIGLQSYNIWTATPEGQDADAEQLSDQGVQLSLAFYILFMFSVLAAGVMAIVTLVSMRSKSIATGSALGWTIALTICMFVWTILYVIEYGVSQPNVSRNVLGVEGFVACDFLIVFFQFFSYICILFLAKARVWNESAVQPAPQDGYQNNGYQYGAPPHQQQGWNGQQYAYQGQPGQQPYYYNNQGHGQPVYNNNGHAHEVGHGLPHEVKA